MKKIHEQEWTRRRVGVIGAAEGVTIEVKVAFWTFGSDAAAETAARETEALAMSAPNLARALLEGLEAFESFGNEKCDHAVNICWCAQKQALHAMRDALRSAGVL